MDTTTPTIALDDCDDLLDDLVYAEHEALMFNVPVKREKAQREHAIITACRLQEDGGRVELTEEAAVIARALGYLS